MGGRLTARSVTGQGSSFSLIIPTRALAQGEDPQVAAAAPAAQRKPLSILVVDDHAATRRLAAVFLSEAASHVATASSGDQALAMLAQERFDVVLTDLLMPQMDGYALAGAIRALGPQAGGGVPVVAYSAESAAWDTGRAQSLGIMGFVAKPFTPSSLFGALASAFAAAQAEDDQDCGAPPRGGTAAGEGLRQRA
jgi:CheY-like chemotaxis protein